jgi:predicted outer membrane repeat protein
MGPPLVIVGLLLLSLLAWTCSGAIIYVNVSSTSQFSVGTLTNPCKNLYCGIRRATRGSIIMVAPGLYTGPSNCNLCNSTNCPANFTVIGTGGPADVVIKAQNSSAHRAFTLLDLTYVSFENLSFENFVLPTSLSYNEQLLTNSIPNGGGAVTVTQTNLHLKSIIFNNNSAAEGGALRALNSNVTISKCSFINNQGTLYGGAVLMETSNVVITDSDFTANSAVGSADLNVDGSGGALYVVGSATSTFAFSSLTFVNNSAGQSGGAIYLRSTSAIQEFAPIITIDNSVFEGRLY